MNPTTPHLLIIDDQPSARETLKALLHPEGYRLTLAASGDEALACLRQSLPDTILLDVMMPGIDGLELCRRLKAEDRWRHIPVILITALDSQEDIAAGLDAGADDFLSKPVQRLELRARVRSMLRLKKQFDELQTMLQLREDMAHMIVHDLRNPLAPIRGLSELLLIRHQLAPEVMKDITTIHTQALRLNDYLDDLLLLAKMENGGLMLNRSMIGLNELMEAVKENHQAVAESKRVELLMRLPESAPELFLDTKLMRRVLDNLFSNALKFSPPRSTVRVTLDYLNPLSEDDVSPAFRLKIADEGPGIPLQHRHSIFDKFKIIDLQKKEVPQIGLGLAFCKLVIEAHGGTIFVEDNQPKGAVFIIEI